ncbi:nucleotidyltransferase domain-containing protein [Candidatus Microgenomates bacterium]|nr:nucleotidyltransferase domain-containing protein [Candidatus Microgenomates bacterium]
MRLKINEMAAVEYADIFDWPLTVAEAKKWAIKVKPMTNKTLDYKISKKQWERRKEKEKKAAKKILEAEIVAKSLARMTTIKAVFLTGSVAVGNAGKNADIDLMIVTVPGALWLTRLVVVIVLKLLGLYRRTICPNIFLDTKHLEIKEKNLYTAHEVLQAKCLVDKGKIKRLWLRKNNWTKDYLPNAYKLISAAV